MKNNPIIIAAVKILINLFIKIKLKLNKYFLFKKINNTIELNQDEILVAMGIIINPMVLKYKTLIKIFNKTEKREI